MTRASLFHALPVGRSRLRVAALACAALVMGACASPDPRYYTLAEPHDGAGTAGALAPAPTPATQAQPLWIEVAPVRVPERLNRQQIVVQDSPAGSTSVRVLDLSRWTSPLPDELRDALAQRLQVTLGAIDTYQQGLSEMDPVYRITTEVVRLDATIGERAAATVNWTVRRLPDGRIVSGRTDAVVPASGDVDGVVAAYRQIVTAAAADIGQAVDALRRGAATGSGPGSASATPPAPLAAPVTPTGSATPANKPLVPRIPGMPAPLIATPPAR